MYKIIRIFGGIILLTVFVSGFIAYFKFGTGPDGIIDGFGRSLSESPWLFRLILGQERLWAGWQWFLVDMIVFWGGVGLAMFLMSVGDDEEKASF